jgi:hypothetical protein
MLALASRASALDELVLEDVFGRRLNERGMVLVDWEGQIANPADPHLCTSAERRDVSGECDDLRDAASALL